jgi:hypothetical protein
MATTLDDMTVMKEGLAPTAEESEAAELVRQAREQSFSGQEYLGPSADDRLR